MSELTRALDHGIQSAGTFLEVCTGRLPVRVVSCVTARSLQTNSALLANTLALDKLNEHDGVEVRAPVLERRRCSPLRARARFAHRLGLAPGAWELELLRQLAFPPPCHSR